jgi:hypothetical protein
MQSGVPCKATGKLRIGSTDGDVEIMKWRRVFQYRVRTLLLLPALFAAGWWWVTWPERSARRFTERLAAGDVDGARAMSDLPEPCSARGIFVFAETHAGAFDLPVFEPASIREYFTATRRFIIPWRIESTTGAWRAFVAVRGRILPDPTGGGTNTRVYVLRRIPAEQLVAVLAQLYAGDTKSKFVADSRNNTVIVSATEDRHLQIDALIEALGEPPPHPEWSAKYPPRISVDQIRRSLAPYLKTIESIDRTATGNR